MTHQCGSCSDSGCTGLCRGLSISEGEVWRRAYAAALAAASKVAREVGELPLAAAIRALPVPDPRPEPSGWSYRG